MDQKEGHLNRSQCRGQTVGPEGGQKEAGSPLRILNLSTQMSGLPPPPPGEKGHAKKTRVKVNANQEGQCQADRLKTSKQELLLGRKKLVAGRPK